MVSKNVQSVNLWSRGVVLSFDLDTERLKQYFSKKSPHGAYDIIKRYLVSNGFEHKKDSDYVNTNINKVATVDLISNFAYDKKWFPLCVNKMNISPNVEALDVTLTIEELADDAWKEQKDRENMSAIFEENDAEAPNVISDANHKKA